MIVAEPYNPHDLFAMPKVCAIFFGSFGVLAIVFPRVFLAISSAVSKIPIIGHKTQFDDEPFFRSALWGRICGIIIAAIALGKIRNR